MTDFIVHFICYFAVPVWMIAGISDWYCHRLTHIETTSGVRESLIHIIMLIEMGLPILAALFLEVNSLVFLLALGMWLLHEATTLWDVQYAHTRRYLSPIEQHIHSFLELMPLLIFSMLCALHWPQFLSLFGFGPEQADFALRWKYTPLPTYYLSTLLICIVVFQIIPYGEELYRCFRQQAAH